MDSAHVTPRWREWAFVAALALVILASRIQAIRFPHELNVDESLMLAQASRFSVDLVPWRSVDSTTSGPVDSWALLLAHAAGMPLTFTYAHALAAVLLSATVGCLYLGSRREYGALPAGIGATAATVWIALNQGPDFIHYTSELVPVLLISAAIAIGTGRLGSIAAALLLGIVPWAKLQAAPIAACAGLWIMLRAVLPASPHWRSKSPAARVFGLLAASLACTALVLGMVFAGNAAEEMWKSYFGATSDYAGPLRVGTISYRFAAFVVVGTGGWLTILCILRLYLGNRPWTRGGDSAIFPWVLAAVSVFTCVRTGTKYEHYQLLMIPALTLITSATFAEWECIETSDATRIRIAAVALIVFACTRLPDAYLRFRTRMEYESPFEAVKAAAAIHELAPQAKTMAIWGWFPSLYIETGLRPATRHAINHFLVLESPSRDFLRASFMQDLSSSGTDVFVDSGTEPLGTFGALDAFVRLNYRLVRKIDGATPPMSIYVRSPASANLPTAGH